MYNIDIQLVPYPGVDSFAKLSLNFFTCSLIQVIAIGTMTSRHSAMIKNQLNDEGWNSALLTASNCMFCECV